MGRTFGLLIVIVGVWLVAALPTREPLVDAGDVGGQAGATAAGSEAGTTRAVVAAGAKDAKLTSNRVLATSAERATVASETRDAARGLPAEPANRSKRGPDERAHAARSRDLEAEPEVGTKAPQPVLITAMPVPTPSVPSAAAPVTGPAPRGDGPSFVPVPIPVSPPGPISLAASAQTANGPVAEPLMRLAKTDSVANGTVSADRVSQPTLATAPVPLQAANPVPPPRIMDQVRAALRAEPRPPGPASAAPTITVLVRPAAPTTATASDKLSSERSKAIGKEAVPETKGPTKTAVRKEHRVVVTRAEPAHVAAQPHQHRTRIAQAYAPPVYLGRVKVQYAPPMPLFVLGGGGSYGGGAVRRTQFNSASMWDTLKRQGM